MCLNTMASSFTKHGTAVRALSMVFTILNLYTLTSVLAVAQTTAGSFSFCQQSSISRLSPPGTWIVKHRQTESITNKGIYHLNVSAIAKNHNARLKYIVQTCDKNNLISQDKVVHIFPHSIERINIYADNIDQFCDEFGHILQIIPLWMLNTCNISLWRSDVKKVVPLEQLHSNYWIAHFCKSRSSTYHLTIFTTCENMSSPAKVNIALTSRPSVSHNRRRRQAQSRPEFAQKLYALSVPEEQDAGFVVRTITASDSGGSGRLSYLLRATEDSRSQDMFAIDSVTGQITTSQRLDRESMARHEFKITATRDGSPHLSAEADVWIDVEDRNDHAPSFENEVAYTE